MNQKTEQDWLKRRQQEKAGHDADQTELRAMQLAVVSVEEGLRDDKLADTIEESSETRDPAWSQRDQQLDVSSGRVSEELIRRGTILGDTYPFVLEGSKLRYRGSKTRAY